MENNFPRLVQEMQSYVKEHETEITSKTKAAQPISIVKLPVSKEPAKPAADTVTKPIVPIQPLQPLPTLFPVNLRRDPLFSSSFTDGRFILKNNFEVENWKLGIDQQASSTTNRTSVLVWAFKGAKLQIGASGIFGVSSARQTILNGNCQGNSTCMSSEIDTYYLTGTGGAVKFTLNSDSATLRTFANANAVYRSSFDVTSTDHRINR